MQGDGGGEGEWEKKELGVIAKESMEEKSRKKWDNNDEIKKGKNRWKEEKTKGKNKEGIAYEDKKEIIT